MVMLVPQQGGSQVETESVDAHLGHPVPQRIQHQPLDPGLAGVQRIPAAGDVVVVAVVFGEPVVAAVVDPAQAQGRALVAALPGVVIDDIQDYLDPGLVQGRDHFLELGHLGANLAVCGVGLMRGEEPQRVVAPVVGQPRAHHERLRNEVMDRE